MIIKSLTRKSASYGQLLDYMLRESALSKSDLDKNFIIKRNLTGDTIEEWVQQFQSTESVRKHRRQNSTMIHHEIISFDENDAPKLTKSVMEDLASEYINLRSPYGQVIASPHFDTQSPHIHLCINGVDLMGNANSLRKKEFAKIKEHLQHIQIEKYGLEHSVVQHGSRLAKYNNKEIEQKFTTNKQSKREIMKEKIDEIYMQSHSKEDFLNRLKEIGIDNYTRNQKLTGIVHEGKKHRFKTLGYEDKLQALVEREQRLTELESMRSTERMTVSQEYNSKQSVLENRLKQMKKVIKEKNKPIQAKPKNTSKQSNDIIDHIADGMTDVGNLTITTTKAVGKGLNKVGKKGLKVSKKASKVARGFVKGALEDYKEKQQEEKMEDLNEMREGKDLDEMPELET